MDEEGVGAVLFAASQTRGGHGMPRFLSLLAVSIAVLAPLPSGLAPLAVRALTEWRKTSRRIQVLRGDERAQEGLESATK